MDPAVLETKIKELGDRLAANIEEAKTAQGARLEELKTAIATCQRQVDAVDLQLQEPNRHAFSGTHEDPLKKAIEESPEFARLRELGSGKCTIKIADLGAIQTKTTVTTDALGYTTPGVLPVAQVGPGVVPLAQRRLFLRDLLFRGQRITTGSAFFIQEQTFTNNASPQGPEGTLKQESGDTFTTTTKNAKTLAHWLPISRQALEDAPTLVDFIRRKLLFGLRYKEEVLFLSNAGIGTDITGLIVAATAYNTALNGTSWNKADILRRALQQVERADEAPTGFYVIHPDNWAEIELLKDSQGRYIVGDPHASTVPRLWGRPVVVSTAMATGTFLAGSTESAEIIDRTDATIEISLDYSDYRARNLAMILCEARTLMCIYRPAAFIYGTLNSSP